MLGVRVKVAKIGNVMDMRHSKSSKGYMIVTASPDEIIGIPSTSIEYYLDLLMNKAPDFSFMKSSGIVRQQFNLNRSDNNWIPEGIIETPPVVGRPFNIGYFHTSDVYQIIDDVILITKNSVYLLYSLIEERDKKLNNLGI